MKDITEFNKLIKDLGSKQHKTRQEVDGVFGRIRVTMEFLFSENKRLKKELQKRREHELQI